MFSAARPILAGLWGRISLRRILGTKRAWKTKKHSPRRTITRASRGDTSAQSSAARADFFVVGIGASAGGLEAVTQFLRSLPPDPGMAFLFVLHLDPTHPSRISEILQRTAPIPVTEAVDGDKIERDRLYVIPPNATLTVKGGAVRLVPRARTRDVHLPVDALLQSLASDYKERAVGVILSGTGSDGSLGVRAIKADAGFTFAQDEESAAQSGMPLNAVDTGCIDVVGSPSDITRELMTLKGYWPPRALVGEDRKDPPRAGDEATTNAASHPAFAAIFRLLRGTNRDVDFSLYKLPTIGRRVSRRMALARVESLEDYARHLQSHPAEVEALKTDLLINVTAFFRDPEVFDILATTVFPALLEERRAPDDPLRIWIPGCATGEEVYSIAMTFFECCGDRAAETPIQIFGTDVSEAVIARARSGLYVENIKSAVSSTRLRRFFTKVDSGYQVNKPVREMCIFARQNLAKDAPFSKLDLVSCRNVLIYMTPPLQSRIMRAFHFALKPGGFLILGSAETVTGYADLFTVSEREHHVYLRKPGPATIDYKVSLPAGDPGRTIFETPPRTPSVPLRDAYREIDRILLDKYAPSGVVLNDTLDIVQFRGDASPYLAPAPGQASLNIAKMARSSLSVTLPDLIRDARRRNTTVTRPDVRFDVDGRTMAVDIEVTPIALTPGDRHFLLVFRAPQAPSSRTHHAHPPGQQRQRRPSAEASQLSEELAATKRHLHSVVEDQEATNEELKSANEEIIASNEELQSTNEELETAHEELQSSNQELTTLNEQLQQHNAELSLLNNDLGNILSSVNIPILLVDHDLLIRRVTPGAGRRFNILPTDIGRPLANIRVGADGLEQLDVVVQDVINTVTPRDLPVRGDDGRRHSLRIRPYRTAENRIEGALLALVDVEELEKTTAARDYARAIVDTVREPLIVLDGDLRVQEANTAFYNTFHLLPTETEGRLFYELSDREWDLPALRRALEDVLPRKDRVTDVEVEHDFRSIGPRVMLLNASAIPGPRALILLAIEDVTVKRLEARGVGAAHLRALELERLAREEAEAASRAKDTFLATLSHELRTPLTSMVAWVRMLRSGRLDERATARALESLERNTRTQTELIEDLLDVSRITSGKVGLNLLPLDVGPVVETAIDGLRPAAEPKSIQIDVQLDAAPGPVLGDRRRLQQIVWNLLSNAIKFTPPGGRVDVRLEWADYRARLTVRDTGIGMKADLLPRIFDRFRQADESKSRSFGGLGLGLAIVRHLVELHGGTVTADSEGEGQGSTFRVELPFSAVSTVPAGGGGVQTALVGEMHAESTALEGVRILLVEDDPESRDALTAVLRLHGATVSAVGSSNEALKALGDQCPDVLISDIAMPGGDGYELMRAVRALPAEAGGQVPAIALSAYVRVDDSRQSIAAGFSVHLPKPIDPGVLVHTVAQLRKPA